MKTQPEDEISIQNTGWVMKNVNAEFIVVIEAEDRISLKEFSEMVITNVGGKPYDNVMLINGNDSRGMDVALMTRKRSMWPVTTT